MSPYRRLASTLMSRTTPRSSWHTRSWAKHRSVLRLVRRGRGLGNGWARLGVMACRICPPLSDSFSYLGSFQPSLLKFPWFFLSCSRTPTISGVSPFNWQSYFPTFATRCQLLQLDSIKNDPQMSSLIRPREHKGVIRFIQVSVYDYSFIIFLFCRSGLFSLLWLTVYSHALWEVSFPELRTSVCVHGLLRFSVEITHVPSNIKGDRSGGPWCLISFQPHKQIHIQQVNKLCTKNCCCSNSGKGLKRIFPIWKSFFQHHMKVKMI